MKITNCCGASEIGDGCAEIGICPMCGEHCDWEDDREEQELADEADDYFARRKV